jgi:endonuclease YncB( thermonuclease family)
MDMYVNQFRSDKTLQAGRGRSRCLLACLGTLAMAISFPAFAKKIEGERNPVLCDSEDPEQCFPIDGMAEVQGLFQNIKFDHALDGDSFTAEDYSVDIWGVAAPVPSHPASLVSKWFLETLLKEGALTCKQIKLGIDRSNVMHCFVDGLDVGSLIVQMGMGAAAEDYYRHEENVAKEQGRGIWKQEIGQ